jgi:hypothetical protein
MGTPLNSARVEGIERHIELRHLTALFGRLKEFPESVVPHDDGTAPRAFSRIDDLVSRILPANPLFLALGPGRATAATAR